MDDIVKLPDGKVTIVCTSSQGEFNAVLKPVWQVVRTSISRLRIVMWWYLVVILSQATKSTWFAMVDGLYA